MSSCNPGIYRLSDPDPAVAYRELTRLNTCQADWPAHIDEAALLAARPPVKLQAKAIWFLGEAGLRFPEQIKPRVPEIAAFLQNETALLRCRGVTALGRIGRGSPAAVTPFLSRLLTASADEDAGVRMNFIWACENIATTAPELFAENMEIFAGLLGDTDTRVRIEAPEIFRVIGKRRPDLVKAYIPLLQIIAETDENTVVRVHAAGAVRAAQKLWDWNVETKRT